MKVCFCVYLPERNVLIAAAIVGLSTCAAYVLLWRTPRSLKYRKLKEDEIRLLVIKKDKFSNPVIRCSIKHAELAQRPEYAALSYAWGSQTATKTIICSGAEVPVTANLYTALRRLRLTSQDYVLWVDAIAINQNDVEERNSQVAMMGRIYSLAHHTVIWLGEQENHEGERAFQSLIQLDSYLGSCSASYANGGPIENSPQFAAGIRQVNFSSLKVLFDKPWFRRLWVVQEVVKSRQSIVRFGTQAIQWTLLERVLYAITSIGGLDSMNAQIGEDTVRNILSVVRTAYNQDRFQIREDTQFDLVALLYDLYLRECKDPRDKIYALLGLAWSEGLTPNYHLEPREVVRQFVNWSITQDVSLRFLSLAGISHHNPKTADPSWFPSVLKSYRPRAVIGWATRSKASKVSLLTEERESSLEGVSVEAGILTLIGSKVDEISTITKMSIRFVGGIHSVDMRTQMGEDMAKVVLEAHALAHKSFPFEDEAGEERFVQFCCALSLGECKFFENRANIVRAIINQYKTYQTTRDPADLCVRTTVNPEAVVGLGNLIGDVLHRRHFAITSEERFGMAPALTQKGDWVVVFRGSTVPFVVRPRKDGHFTLVGECYISGIMMGEALEDERFEWDVFKLR